MGLLKTKLLFSLSGVIVLSEPRSNLCYFDSKILQLQNRKNGKQPYKSTTSSNPQRILRTTLITTKPLFFFCCKQQAREFWGSATYTLVSVICQVSPNVIDALPALAKNKFFTYTSIFLIITKYLRVDVKRHLWQPCNKRQRLLASLK